MKNGAVELALQRALDDVEMWKETALAALGEVKDLKKDQPSPKKNEDDDCDDAS